MFDTESTDGMSTLSLNTLTETTIIMFDLRSVFVVQDFPSSQTSPIFWSSAMPACKRSSQLGLLAIRIPSQEAGWGRSRDPRLSVQLLYITCHLPFSSHFMWPWRQTSLYVREDQWKGGSIYVSMKKALSLLGKGFLWRGIIHTSVSSPLLTFYK